MRFKTEISRDKHSDFSTCASWISNEEVISLSDDHTLMTWNPTSGDQLKRIDLPPEFYPTDVHAYTKSTPAAATGSSAGSKNTTDLFVVSTSDGKIHLMNRSGRLEKTVEAHAGAALTVRWSPDGSAVSSAGEDGLVKIWSKNLMLRSTFSSQATGVHCLSWSMQSDQLVFAAGTRIELKALQPNSKPVTWKAHSALILSISWNHNNNKILSAAEDCKYKVWDCFGRILFVSSTNDFPITSANWSPDGNLFAIGSFNTLKLCSDSGFTYSNDKPQVNSLYRIAWSSDSSSVAAVSSSGHLVFAYVIDRHLEWKNIEIVTKERKVVEVRNVIENTIEELEFKENVIKMSIAFNHIVVITTGQGAVYKTSKLLNQYQFPVKESVNMIMQCDKSFLLVSQSMVLLFSYEGKQLLNIKWPGMRPDSLNQSNIALSCDTIAVKDDADNKVILMIDSQSGKLMNTSSIRHTIDVVSIRVSMCGGAPDRKCAFIDKNSDLYLSLIRASPLLLIRTIKLTAMVRDIRWCEDNDMLAALSESTGRIVVFTYPHVVFCDRQLLPETMSEREAMGNISLIDSFTDSIVQVKKADGSVMAIGVNPLLHLLHQYASSKKWKEALRLCRTTDTLDEHDRESRLMWSSFAGMALSSRQLDHCESAYSEIDRVDKVNYIQRITEISDAVARNGETCLLMGSVREAEMIFLQAGFNLRVIVLNLDLFNWNRALELALKVEQKDGLYVRLVLTQRAAYLSRFNQREENKNFTKVADEYESLDNATIDSLKKNPFEKTRVISSAVSASTSSAPRIGSNSSASSSSASSGRTGKKT